MYFFCAATQARRDLRLPLKTSVPISHLPLLESAQVILNISLGPI
jgi:hypothetical protein